MCVCCGQIQRKECGTVFTQDLRYQKQLSCSVFRQHKVSGSGSARRQEYTLLKENYVYFKRGKEKWACTFYFFFFFNVLY